MSCSSPAEGSSERGAVAVETALSFLPFALFIFGLIHLIFFAHTVMSLQYALSKATRWGILGLTLSDQDGQPLSREGSIEQRFEDAARAYGLDPDQVILRICPIENPGCSVSQAAGSDKWMILAAEMPSRALFGLGRFGPSARIIVKNEPF